MCVYIILYIILYYIILYYIIYYIILYIICVYIISGPNRGFEFVQRYECIKLLEYQKREEILQKDKSFLFCFMFSLDKYALL